MGYPTTYQEAVVYQNDLARQVARNKEVRRKRLKPDPATEALLEVIQGFVPRGRYRYYETDGVKPLDYDVLEVLDDVVTGNCYVMLAPCFGLRKGKPELWLMVGGTSSFLSPVEVPGFRGVRFTPVKEESDDNIVEV